MPLIRNVSTSGDLDVPLLRRTVEAGETVEVTDEQAENLLVPSDHPSPNYAPADDAAQAIVDRLDNVSHEAEREALGIPEESAKKSDWVAYAFTQGAVDPESMTKQQLIDEYGREDI